MKLTPEQMRAIAEKRWPTTHELKLFSHIEALEAEIENLRDNRDFWEREWHGMDKKLIDTRKENARYKEALEEIENVATDHPLANWMRGIASKYLKGADEQ